jgi:heterodisulfide reductase subunit A
MEIRIGVFLCDCGNEVSRIIDTKEVKRTIDEEGDDVRLTFIHPHLCDEQGMERMKVLLQENGIDRVVLGACSPQLHLETFRKVLSSVGINQFMLEMVNLREHCSWVHTDSGKATEKAKRLMRGAIRKIRLSQPIEPQKTSISKEVLVIGAGVAGTNVAMELAKKGHKTHLVEKQPWIGGNTARVGLAFPTDDCAYCIGARSEIGGVRKCFYRAGLSHYPHLNIITNADIKSVDGYVGNFRVVVEERPTFVEESCISCEMCEEVCKIEVTDTFNRGFKKRKAIYKQFEAIPNKYIIDFDACNVCKDCERVCPEGSINFSQREKKHELRVGAIVVTTGFREFDARKIKEYGYGRYKGVLTQLDFARFIDPSGPTGGKIEVDGKIPEVITMIQCVGSRNKEFNLYCSRLCCMMALKHAGVIKKRYPEIEVNICYMDVRTTGVGGYEDYYDKARMLGVNFLHGRPSEVVERNGRLVVRTEDSMLGRIDIETDLVLLSCGIESSDGTREMAGLLGLDLDKDNFITLVDPKVRGLSTSRWGVFIAGGARGPTDIPESILQAKAVVSDVTTILARDEIVDFRIHPKVDTDLCDGCEVCTVKCPFAALKINLEERRSELNRDACHGCGTCSSNCPNGAVQLINFTDQQIFAQLEGILSLDSSEEGIIVGFICNECGYASSDLAGVERFRYTEAIHLIQVPCLGRVSAIHILKGFELGAKGVILVGCMEGRCHYRVGTQNATQNIELVKETLKDKDNLAENIWMVNLCGAKSHDFAGAMNKFAKKVLGGQ